MADITWPTTGGRMFDPVAFDEAIEFNVELTVARSGKVSTQSLPGARFRCTLAFRDEAVSTLRQRRQLEAFFASLRGGADRLLLWHLLTPEPLGTMRGAVTLAAAVAAGATTAQITGGVTPPNLLVSSGFEIDSNADGLADGWTGYTAGTTGAVTYSRTAGNGSTFSQFTSAAGLGATTGDQLGLFYTANVPVTEGVAYTLSADTLASGGTVRLQIAWVNAGNVSVGVADQSFVVAGSSWVRRSLSGTAPATAAACRIYLWLQAAPGGPAAANLRVDNVQFEAAATATAYAGLLPTLLRGDRIAFGGQRVMLTADLTANDAGAGAISFQPAHRAGAASAAAVTLIRPTTRYVLTQPVVQMPARGSVLPGFSVELVEE